MPRSDSSYYQVAIHLGTDISHHAPSPTYRGAVREVRSAVSELAGTLVATAAPTPFLQGQVWLHAGDDPPRPVYLTTWDWAKDRLTPNAMARRVRV